MCYISVEVPWSKESSILIRSDKMDRNRDGVKQAVGEGTHPYSHEDICIGMGSFFHDLVEPNPSPGVTPLSLIDAQSRT